MFFRSIQDKITISDLKLKLQEANTNVERLKVELLNSKTHEEVADATFAIDFNSIRCFSVERNVSNSGKPITILGYNLLTDGESIGPREWTLYCSAKQHETLVEQFNKQKKGK